MRKAPIVLLILSLFTFLPAPASAAALPGGKAYFVVSRGSFKTGTANWTRLSDYTFTADGKVRANTYLWQQSKPVARQGTGLTPDSSCSTTSLTPDRPRVRACEVMTAGGFGGAPHEDNDGNYRIDGDQLHITWNVAGWNEQWTIVTSPDTKLARLDFRSNALATIGYGYGSNTPLNVRRQMSSVQAHPGDLDQDSQGWERGGPFTSPPSKITPRDHSTCTTTSWCLTYLQPQAESSCTAGCKATNTDRSIQYYVMRISNSDRRDTRWHWCSCLTDVGEVNEFCYKRNSHVKPMLQILDDDARFRGWVGVEASFDYKGDRTRDMLAAFRLSDFR
ncbi:hypothetical protein [Lentzea californiensis]|uniref:hypothetical protein n=1 Tax=Lentzea californiensis TaxID=438851 RepID=UPI002166B00D|nr:hypothetical protein [Lentzea californiensis]MCR3750921.1 hypothetical protein [Lentzea californiensis]